MGEEFRLNWRLIEAVERLIRNPPPRNPPWWRRRWRAMVAWTRKRLSVTKDRKAVDNNEGDAG